MDRFLNPEDISIRRPLFWFGTVFSLALAMASLVQSRRVGMTVGLGGLLYQGEIVKESFRLVPHPWSI